MSEQTASSTREVEIYVPLLNEGTDVLRPTTGIVMGQDVVRIVATRDYDPENETWAFPPDTMARCFKESRGGREVLVARQQVA